MSYFVAFYWWVVSLWAMPFAVCDTTATSGQDSCEQSETSAPTPPPEDGADARLREWKPEISNGL